MIGRKKLNKGSFGFDVALHRARNESMARKYKLGAIGISMFETQFAIHDPDFHMEMYFFFRPNINKFDN